MKVPLVYLGFFVCEAAPQPPPPLRGGVGEDWGQRSQEKIGKAWYDSECLATIAEPGKACDRCGGKSRWGEGSDGRKNV